MSSNPARDQGRRRRGVSGPTAAIGRNLFVDIRRSVGRSGGGWTIISDGGPRQPCIKARDYRGIIIQNERRAHRRTDGRRFSHTTRLRRQLTLYGSNSICAIAAVML